MCARNYSLRGRLERMRLHSGWFVGDWEVDFWFARNSPNYSSSLPLSSGIKKTVARMSRT
jgi:hypothetical protein